MDDYLEKLNEDISTHFFKNVVIYDEHARQKVVRIRDKKPIPLPKYSTDIDAAYHIIKKIKSKSYEVTIGFNITNELKKNWYIHVNKQGKSVIKKIYSENLPELICKIGLLILEKEKEFDNIKPTVENIVTIDFSKKVD